MKHPHFSVLRRIFVRFPSTWDVKSAKILDIDAFDSETENENAVMLLCRNLNVKAIVAQQLTEKRKCL